MKQNEASFRPDRIVSYFRTEWKPLTLVTVSGLIYNVGLLAGPWFEGQMAQCLANILSGSEAAATMAKLVIAYLAAILLVQSARFVKRFYVRRFANNINRRMKGILYANLVRKSRHALDSEDSGELITKAISDVDDCAEGMRKFTTELFDTGVALIAYIVMLFVYDFRLALLCLIFPPVSYISAELLKKKVQESGAVYKKASAALSAATLDRAGNAITYRVYGCEKTQEQRYETVLNRYERTAVLANLWQAALPPLYLVVSNLSVIFILYFGGKNVLGTGWSTWNIAAFTTFLSCFVKMATKSSKAAKLFNSVQRAEVSWKRIKPLMKKPEELPRLENASVRELRLDHVRFCYDKNAPVFQDLSLLAHPGEIIGVTGPVACGKSTLGRMFLCEQPYEGSILLNGRELSGLSSREIAAFIGYLGHDPELQNDTIAANVLCGSCGDPLKYLALTEMDQETLEMEQGTDTLIGSSGIRLSGGQAKRLALSRTLAHPRPVLILDDPFSALDRNTEDAVFATLKEYAKDKIVFLISHRLYHFPEMKEVIFMEDGKVTVGTHEELLEKSGSYKSLYESQTGGKSDEENGS